MKSFSPYSLGSHLKVLTFSSPDRVDAQKVYRSDTRLTLSHLQIHLPPS